MGVLFAIACIFLAGAFIAMAAFCEASYQAYRAQDLERRVERLEDRTSDCIPHEWTETT
jgi:hypothetical protein